MERNRITAIAFGLALAAAANSWAATVPPVTRTFNAGAGGTLHIKADSGDIKVTSGAQNGVTVSVERSGDRAEIDRYKITMTQQGNDVVVNGDYDQPRMMFHWFNDIDVHYVVTVPARYNVELSTSGGDIRVSDLQGTATVKTSGGDIELGRIAGPVTANTSGGDVTVASAAGPVIARTSGGRVHVGNGAQSVEAKSSGGSIEIGHAGGDLIARTSGGSISIDDASGLIDAHTSGGSISARITKPLRGESKLSTSGGNVTISLATGIAVDLDAHTSGGRVHSDVPVTVNGTMDEDELRGKVNGGGPRLVLRSSGGGIRIHKL